MLTACRARVASTSETPLRRPKMNIAGNELTPHVKGEELSRPQTTALATEGQGARTNGV